MKTCRKHSHSYNIPHLQDFRCGIYFINAFILKLVHIKIKGEKKYIVKENLNIDLPWSKRSHIRFFMSGGEKLTSKSES